jgi:hypothetical protein
MRAASWRMMFTTLLAASVGACRNSNPAAPVNHNPIISSVVLFPTVIGSTDSAIAICSASDPDGDSLVYDWVSDGRLRLKDAPRGAYIYSSPRNSEVFYRAGILAPNDTALIWCYTRDLRGGQDGRLIALRLHP